MQIKPIEMSAADTLCIEVRIENVGQREGDEVIQLYLQDVEASVDREIKSLKCFKRVHLCKGESRIVTFSLNINDLSFYSERQKLWIAEPGQFKAMVGSSSRDIRLTKEFTLNLVLLKI